MFNKSHKSDMYATYCHTYDSMTCDTYELMTFYTYDSYDSYNM